MSSLETIDIESWENPISEEIQIKAIESLEAGKVLYFPKLSFPINQHETPYISPDKIDPKTKNISYDIRKDHLAGTLHTGEEAQVLKEMIKRYSMATRHFLGRLAPNYTSYLGKSQARTSYRPVEIFGRKSPSYRKDDTLVHVDAFPSSPTQGNRILRVFTNINAEGKSRVWHLGEPFEDVVKKIAPKTSNPLPGIAYLLNWFGITKNYRTLYDHYMIQIHDLMKGDHHYQTTVPKEEVHFPAGSSWIVYTDQVSHAALSGQHVLEQTFNLPMVSLKNAASAPLSILERHFDKLLA
jgi:3-deoxy-D-manno-oct-2-ulosonic acid (Kdo) hydroxylase